MANESNYSLKEVAFMSIEELARKNLDNEVTYNDKKRKRKF